MNEQEFPYDFKEGEVLLIDKPTTWTSFDVVKKIRGIIRVKKVGHAGTLDPLATGLLILCTGKFTKKINDMQGLDKEYTGSIYLGATTPCYDREMEPDEQFDISHITVEMIKEAAKGFEGEIEQIPPVYSALKVGGEKLYHKARKGEKITPKARQVVIHSFEIEKVELPLVYFKVKCSKGTYIRSLAHDLGKALNAGAHLYGLRRTKVGEYSIDDAWNLQELADYLIANKALILENARSQEH